MALSRCIGRPGWIAIGAAALGATHACAPEPARRGPTEVTEDDDRPGAGGAPGRTGGRGGAPAAGGQSGAAGSSGGGGAAGRDAGIDRDAATPGGPGPGTAPADAGSAGAPGGSDARPDAAPASPLPDAAPGVPDAPPPSPDVQPPPAPLPQDAAVPEDAADAVDAAPSSVSLPMAVTDHFPDQGWFGDGRVSALFTPGSTLIRQRESTTGPCAARPVGAAGKCLQIDYTPPAGFTAPPTGNFVGVFFLTTVRSHHPQLSPPVTAGEPNWGAEPGVLVDPGARTVTFYATAGPGTQPVSFKAGVNKERFTVPERTEVLDATWRSITLPITGTYDDGIVGGFAWILKDTTKATTFYLDAIVWR